MKRIHYPGTQIPIQVGDLVLWYDDDTPSKVVFIISTNQFPAEEAGSIDWFRTEFGAGIMIDTPTVGRVLESEDCEHITLINSAQP
ncbi:hypothetical protein LVB77_09750 [Lysobacter sp. 5GHs7-4]|uniref:hypothetical protein n=1 Tax=Lysobacter sp. 5GHs7-4 TaxID=2904253 RepID=UPI001E5DDE5E|nr:hypothetical protein [Lysobacter sp. 5GHs7-4]UHQ24929.1 hypothetical protein LVB77_09750 [Lysobacter sp. 5GHs7-4]